MISPAQQVKGQRMVIFFDAAGTMLRLADSVGVTYANFASQFGATLSPSAIGRAFRENWQKEPPRAATAGPRPDDDRGWWRAFAEKTLAASGELPPSFDKKAWFDAVYNHFARPEAWVLYDDVVPTLTQLAPHYRLAVLSNFDRRLYGILKGLGIGEFFERIFISSEIGADKPDRSIFEHAVKAMGAVPGQCVHVGDDPERDWAGATAVGLGAFPLRRPEYALDRLGPFLETHEFRVAK